MRDGKPEPCTATLQNERVESIKLPPWKGRNCGIAALLLHTAAVFHLCSHNQLETEHKESLVWKKTITDRFLGLGGGQRGGGDVGSLSQKHLERGWIQVLHCKTSPRCLEGRGNAHILVGRARQHERMDSIIKTGAVGRVSLRAYCAQM